MKNYRYNLITADLDCGIHEHPQVQMKKLGAKVVKYEPVPIGDCWWFRTENEITPLPEYLFEMPDDFKFSGEEWEEDILRIDGEIIDKVHCYAVLDMNDRKENNPFSNLHPAEIPTPVHKYPNLIEVIIDIFRKRGDTNCQ